MKWKKIQITTTVEAEDYLSSILCELGFEGIEIQDQVQLSEEDKKKMFIDFLPEMDEEDHTAIVTCYMDEDEDVEVRLNQIQSAIEEDSAFIDFGNYHIEVMETEDKDWINNWKKYFKPFHVDEDILIKPTWESIPEGDQNSMIIEIDPGTAFGTGSHETTRLCIQNIKKYMKPGEVVLDVGCGSGILSIIAKKLGAKACVGTDIDAGAVIVARENAEVNACKVVCTDKPEAEEGTVAFFAGDVIGDEEFCKKMANVSYDMVAANILADVIIPLAPVVRKLVKTGGYFISSGIIDMKAEEVRQALEAAGFTIVEHCRMKDWNSFVAI